MRQVEAFFEWEQNQWLLRAYAQMFESEVEREGWAAYAKRQAALRSSLVAAFKSLWNTSAMACPGNSDSTELSVGDTSVET